MSDIAIRVERISKQYHIVPTAQVYDTLRDQIAEGVRGFLRRGVRIKENTIWALRDVSFEIPRGQIVGIIGRNGAGKTTLLKILSRITAPTTGRAQIHGRPGSLLEVGTGFHMELTGRENIYLNGAILGMRKQEIDRKFAEIVEFAELQRFIDTPIKRYSSGMQVRLAFAVAAHLESEILLVDEVLAVGDARFQRKCMAKMEDVGRQGRTVLFVSHSMPAITRLCGRALLFDEGRFLADGPSPEVVGKYLSSGWGVTSRREWSDDGQAPGGRVVRLRRVQVVTEDGEVRDAVDVRRAVGIQIVYDLLEPGHLLMPWFELHNEHGVEVMDAVDVDPAWRRRPRPAGMWTTTAWIPENLLAEGTLFVTVGVKTMEPPVDQFVERDVVAFQVIDPMDGETARGDWGGPFDGAVRPLLRWRTSYQHSDD